jgi:hypothetical protein
MNRPSIFICRRNPKERVFIYLPEKSTVGDNAIWIHLTNPAIVFGSLSIVRSVYNTIPRHRALHTKSTFNNNNQLFGKTRPNEAEVGQAAGPQYSRFSSRCVHVIASVPALSKDEASIPWAKTDIRSH